VLKSPPPRIDIEFLNHYPEFAGFRPPGVSPHLKEADPGLLKIMTEGLPMSIDAAALTPDEQVHIGTARIKDNLVAQILEKIKQGTPAAFERIVVDLLVAMATAAYTKTPLKSSGKAVMAVLTGSSKRIASD
jgi:restriction system protein